ncbi:MAG TPA: C40 family peptidase [Spirochaetota bacterium]|nr:C40 family peptidase [Spirochaetota bacterium]HQO02206.1 C40 family peptidase [Spirochaetota bacterium]HQP49382.1 C40 family peptidase [Spirochaetota bacterium]
MNTVYKNIRIFLVPALCVTALYVSACSPPHLRYGSSYYGSEKRRDIVYTADRYRGVRYRYGGASPRGFDCSGLVMYVYKKNGIRLPRTAVSQYRHGRHVPRQRLKPGDLVFFQTSRSNRLSHVGIYAGRNKFIHAPRPGKRVSYASLGNSYWSRRYQGGVTYLRN